MLSLVQSNESIFINPLLFYSQFPTTTMPKTFDEMEDVI